MSEQIRNSYEYLKQKAPEERTCFLYNFAQSPSQNYPLNIRSNQREIAFDVCHNRHGVTIQRVDQWLDLLEEIIVNLTTEEVDSLLVDAIPETLVEITEGAKES